MLISLRTGAESAASLIVSRSIDSRVREFLESRRS